MRIEACTHQIVQDVLSLVFNLQVRSDSATHSSSSELAALPRGGVVYIVGDWLGSVIYRCSDELLDIMTSRMFEVDRGSSDPSLEVSVICELANMIGGNLKSILGEHCILSLPKTLSSLNYNTAIENDSLILSQIFFCEGQPLLVEIRRSSLNIQELLDSNDFEYPTLRQSTEIAEKLVEDSKSSCMKPGVDFNN